MLRLIVILMCVFLNALFSAFEMAYVTIGPDRLSDLIDKEKKLKLLAYWKKQPERTFSMIQIGITFVGGLAAVVGGPAAQDVIRPVLIKNFGLPFQIAEIFSILGIILPLTYANVVLGELLPKAIALRRPEQVLLFVNPLMRVMDKILNPFINFLEASTEFLLKFLNLSKKLPAKPPTRVHIENLEAFHQNYVLNLVALKGKKNRDILIPWGRVVAIDIHESPQRLLELMKITRHTRLPVIDQGKVLGLLHTKEFLSVLKNKLIPWQNLVRPILRFRSNEKVLNTFIEMQKTQNHFALIEDKQNVPLGFITLEIIIEEILGDIFDEDDDGRIKRVMEQLK